MTAFSTETPSGKPSTSRVIGPSNPLCRSTSTFSRAEPPRGRLRVSAATVSR